MSEVAEKLVDEGKAHDYYYTSEWVHLQPLVMDSYKRECIRCKAKDKKYNKAHILHHVLRLKAHPEVADKTIIPAYQDEKEKAIKSNIAIKQFYNGDIVTLLPIDTDRKGVWEKYYVLELDGIIQLLPLCRECHKIVHRRYEPLEGSLDERFQELL